MDGGCRAGPVSAPDDGAEAEAEDAPPPGDFAQHARQALARDCSGQRVLAIVASGDRLEECLHAVTAVGGSTSRIRSQSARYTASWMPARWIARSRTSP